jgi:hypothetical protein
MTCDQAQSLVMLAASGDAGDRELDLLGRHVDSCCRCAAFRTAYRPLPLGDIRADLPFSEETLADWRSEVMARVTAGQPERHGWAMFILRAAAVAAALLLAVVGLWLRPRHDNSRAPAIAAQPRPPVRIVTAPSHVIDSPAPSITTSRTPDPVTRPTHRRREPAQSERLETASAARPHLPEGPIHMEIYTSDPNVRIIWIAAAETDADPVATPNRSR